MKCMTLAVAILLAVGCQAASLQADAPASLTDSLQSARNYMTMGLDHIKVLLHSIADRVDDADLKSSFKTNIDEGFEKVKTLRENAEPVSDSVVATLEEATRDVRNTIYSDIESLRAQVAPMRTELETTLKKHFDEYKIIMEPLLQDYRTEHDALIANFKAKMEPAVEDLRGKIRVNVEETKSRLVPIIEVIRQKLNDRLQELKVVVTPYMEEYKEQMKGIYAQAQKSNMDDIKTKFQPLVSHIDAIKAAVQGFTQELQGIVGQ